MSEQRTEKDEERSGEGRGEMSEQRTEKAIQVHNALSQVTGTYGLVIQDIVEELNQARAKVRELIENYKAKEEEHRKTVNQLSNQLAESVTKICELQKQVCDLQAFENSERNRIYGDATNGATGVLEE